MLFKCSFCNKHARGYCAICGKLVCDDHSKMIGFMRVCNSCITKYNIRTPNDVYSVSSKLKLTGKPFKNILSVGKDKNFDYKYLFIGLDDFDSPHGMCTTYLIARILPEIEKHAEFMDYPLLIRMNPNVPIKTRGNAGLSLRLKIKKDSYEIIKSKVLQLANELAHTLFGKTQSAIVFLLATDYSVPTYFRNVFYKAMKDIVDYRKVMKELNSLPENFNVEIYSPTEEPRGIVGAIASIGAELYDWTFELLTYRKDSSKPREIDIESVKQMDKKLRPFVFDNLDGDRLLIAPTGPDPVLFGIRGDDPEKLIQAFNLIKHESIDRWVLFRSNQGTAMHIDNSGSVGVYKTILRKGNVVSVKAIKEGTIQVVVKSEEYQFNLFAYKIQGVFRRYLRMLKSGDEILFVANIWEIDHEKGIYYANLEEFSVLKFAPIVELKNPLCPRCGARMKSKGKGIFYCRKCGYKAKMQKIVITKKRRPFPTRKRIIPPPKAHRHLTLPEERFLFRFLKLGNRLKRTIIKPFYGTAKPERIEKLNYIFLDPRAI